MYFTFKNFVNKSFQYLPLLIFAALLPFGRQISTPLIWLCIASSIIMLYYRNKIKFYVSKKAYLFFIPLIIFYFLCALSIVYSVNIKNAFFDWEQKLPLIVFPLIISPFLDQPDLKDKIFVSYIIGCCLASVSAIGVAISNSISSDNGELVFRTIINDATYIRGDSFLESITQGGNYFYGTNISIFMHPTYFGMFLSIGFLLSLFYLLKAKGTIHKIAYTSSAAILLLMVFLSGSKGAMLSLFLTIIFIIFYHFAKSKSWKKKGILIAALFSVSAICFFHPRIRMLTNSLASGSLLKVDYSATESSALRVVAWKASYKVIKENFWIGVGAGDIEQALKEKYLNMNRSAYNLELNSHNQFVNSFVALGVVGFLSSSFLFYFPITMGFKKKDLLMLSVIFIIIFNGLFESILEVYYGIVTYSFFYCINFIGYIKNSENYK